MNTGTPKHREVVAVWIAADLVPGRTDLCVWLAGPSTRTVNNPLVYESLAYQVIPTIVSILFQTRVALGYTAAVVIVTVTTTTPPVVISVGNLRLASRGSSKVNTLRTSSHRHC